MSFLGLKSGVLSEIDYPAYVENDKRESNRAFQDLPPTLQNALFSLPEREIYPEPPYYQKIRLGGKASIYIFLPAQDYIEILKQKETLEKESDFLQNRLRQFIENAPFPLVIVELPEGHIRYVNKLFLEACRLPLKYLYENHTLPEYIRNSQTLKEALLKLHQEANLHQIVHVTLLAGYERYWLLQGYTYLEENKTLGLLGLIDITKEKEQELALEKAYEELNAQHEALTQSQHELLALNYQLTQAYDVIDKQKKDLEDSLRAAQIVQETLLRNDEALEGLLVQVHKLTLSHSYLSGDFLWIQKKRGYVYLAVGDATGHGAAGSLLATLTYAFLSQALYEIQSPQEIHLIPSLVRSYTLKSLQIDEDKVSTEGAELVLVAFHAKAPTENPIYLTGAGGRYVFGGAYYRTDRFGTGFYVPNMPAIEYTSKTFTVQPGQWLWLFTDGILDQFNPHNQKLGRQRLLSWLTQAEKHAHPSRFLEENLHTWRSDVPLNDDITLLGIRF